MTDLSEEIRRLIKERYESVPKLADHLHMPKQTIYTALSSGVLGSSLSTFMPVVAALELDPFQLANGVVAPLSSSAARYVEVPLFGSIAAGQPIESSLAESKVAIPVQMYVRYPRSFLLRVDGDSMNRILPNGCYALVSPCSDIDIADAPYAISIGTAAATIKRVHLLANGFELQPDSIDPTYHPAVYDFTVDNTEEVRIIGRVVWYMLPYNWDFPRRA